MGTGEEKAVVTCDFRLLTAKGFNLNAYLFLKGMERGGRIDGVFLEPWMLSAACKGVSPDVAVSSVDHMREAGLLVSYTMPRIDGPYLEIGRDRLVEMAVTESANLNKMLMYCLFSSKRARYRRKPAELVWEGVAVFAYGYSSRNVNGTVRKRMRGYVEQLEEKGMVGIDWSGKRPKIEWAADRFPVDRRGKTW